MPRRARSQPESEGVNTDGGEGRPRADGQAEKPIRDSKRKSGGVSGRGRALTFQLSRRMGRWLWEGGEGWWGEGVGARREGGW